MTFVAPAQRGFDHATIPEAVSHMQSPRGYLPPLDRDSSPRPIMGLPLTSEPSPPGRSRCHWALLSADLCFLFLDPMLAAQLEDQADALIGRPLLSFVHPDEQSSAKHDLGRVLDSRTLHGSVTRVRYSRLLRIRHRLAEVWSDADAQNVIPDEDYVPADIVINWAAEGLVLCFIHAITDFPPLDGDDQWSAWCGTPHMSLDLVSALYQRLAHNVPSSGDTSRVFQLLANGPERTLLLTWPPDKPTFPLAREFAKLAADVQIGNSLPSARDAKTSCTRRYKALHALTTAVHTSSEVESIFIPYGSIIFACHKMDSLQPRLPDAAISHTPYNSHNLMGPGDAPFYGTSSGQYSLPPSYGDYVPQASNTLHNWRGPADSSSHYSQWGTHALTPPPIPGQHLRHSSSYSSLSSQQQWASPTPGYSDITGIPYSRSISPQYPYGDGSAEGSPNEDVVPLPRGVSRRTSPNTARDQYAAGGRSQGCPPVGVNRCSSCKVTHSPEWRKGPSGKKDLCNACGLRYARSRAKKEGLAPVRRRKPSVASLKQEDTTSIGPSSAGHSPSSSTTGSGYSHPSYDGSTPSPSPPSNQVDFGGHYSYTQPHDGAVQYSNAYPGAYHHQALSTHHASSYPAAVGAVRALASGRPELSREHVPDVKTEYVPQMTTQ